jgi:sugar lactone lactonase YvrE
MTDAMAEKIGTGNISTSTDRIRQALSLGLIVVAVVAVVLITTGAGPVADGGVALADVENASFSQSKNIGSEDSDPTGMAWNDDGSKMYVVGASNDAIYEYDVSTPYDVSTASQSQSKYVGSENSDPTGMAWNDDGSKMYVAGGYDNDAIYEYDVSTPYDISTASYSQSKWVGNELTGIAWNDDGSKMYAAGSFSNLYEYDVSTPYDVSTASQSQSKDVGSELNNLEEVAWNGDGSKMYLISENDYIHEYDVSTPYDISTASHSRKGDISSEDSAASGMAWNDDGSKMYVAGRSDANIYEYDVDPAASGFPREVHGTVTAGDGNGLDNATVEAVDTSTGSTEATTTTNATGGYEMGVESGEYNITASADGYANRTKTVTVPDGGTTVNFTLISGTTISDPDPPDGATVSEPPVELSVLANTTNQSVQTIDVEFYEKNDGSSDAKIGAATVAPGERASVNWDPPPNTYEWYAEGTADSGGSDTGGPYTLAIGEAYIIDGTEQPPDGANVDPTADVDLAVDVRVDDDATVEFYDYQTGNPDNDPLIGSQQVSSGTSTASARWYSNERDATEEWYVILKDSTGTRDTAGAFRFSAGGQVVARDAETGDIIDDRTVRFDTTYPGGSQTFDRSPGVLNLSEVNADQGDRIRIDVRAQNYYERTVEVPNKQSDADIYLERGPNWNSNPSSDDPENTSSVEDDPNRYLSRFEIEDRTGRYPPSNTTLAIKRDMDGDGQVDLIHRSSFGAANRVGAHVKQDREYQLIIENDKGDRRRLGAWRAIGESLVQLQVRAFGFNIPEQGAGWVSHASVEETDNDTEVFRWQFSDPSEATSRLEVAIYERDNRSNGLLNQTYSDLGNVSYTQELTGNQTGKAWVVELEGTRNGESFTSREIVGATDLAPGIPLDPFYQEMFAVLLLLVLAGVFGGIRAETGAIIVPMTAAVLFWMGWLPGVVTASAIAAALFIAVLYRIRSTPQPGVR